jgi:hypothetical protein
VIALRNVFVDIKEYKDGVFWEIRPRGRVEINADGEFQTNLGERYDEIRRAVFYIFKQKTDAGGLEFLRFYSRDNIKNFISNSNNSYNLVGQYLLLKIKC